MLPSNILQINLDFPSYKMVQIKNYSLFHWPFQLSCHLMSIIWRIYGLSIFPYTQGNAEFNRIYFISSLKETNQPEQKKNKKKINGNLWERCQLVIYLVCFDTPIHLCIQIQNIKKISNKPLTVMNLKTTRHTPSIFIQQIDTFIEQLLFYNIDVRTG